MLYNNLDCVQTGGTAAPPIYKSGRAHIYRCNILCFAGFRGYIYDKNSSVDPLCGFHKAGL